MSIQYLPTYPNVKEKWLLEKMALVACSRIRMNHGEVRGLQRQSSRRASAYIVQKSVQLWYLEQDLLQIAFS